MKILLIGNGFDLAHKLKTGYIDFLDFANWIDIVKRKGIDSASSKNKNEYHDIYDRGLCSDEVIEELEVCLCDNCWIKYFVRRKDEIGEGWIDFETEISHIANMFLKAKREYKEADPFGTAVITVSGDDTYLKYYTKFRNMIVSTVSGKEFTKERDNLRDDLKKLTRALELYISYWIDNTVIGVINPDIAKVHPQKIISFNYSHTFERVYGNVDYDIECCYIHGEARRDSDLENNNMVLGIDDQENSKNETDSFYSTFKKYYQRLDKNTDTKYEEWIEKIKSDLASDSKAVHELFVFGHSLDATDKDILKSLLELDNLKITVFYHEIKKRRDLLANLLKILDKELIINKMQQHNLVFKKQAASEAIANSEVEIRTDTKLLYQMNKLSFAEAEEIYEKILSKIDGGKVDYFRTVENTIHVLNGFCLNGLKIDDSFTNKLTEIAWAIIEKNPDIDFIDSSEWAEPTLGERLETLPKVGAYIGTLNELIESAKEHKFMTEEESFCSIDRGPLNAEECLNMFEKAYELCAKNGHFDSKIIDVVNDYILNNLDVAIEALDTYEEQIEAEIDHKAILHKRMFANLITEEIDELNYLFSVQ